MSEQNSPMPTPPVNRPVPKPMPRKLPPRPAGPPKPAPPAATLDAPEAAEAARWGRVDDDGTVWVREQSGERSVGQFPGASADEALALYVRRYLDLHAQVMLLAARLPSLNPKEMDANVSTLEQALVEPAAVGDLDGLRRQLAEIRDQVSQAKAQAEADRAKAKQAALGERTELVEKAEELAAVDPQRVQWRQAGEQLSQLLQQWKDAQRRGPRLDKAAEDALWKRFSHARTVFDRNRRHFFAQLEQKNSEAKALKEQIVAEAEALAGSTEWGPTSGAFRDLMDRWRAAGRASRKDDDALWARFRGAQDAFFTARHEHSAATDAEQRENLAAKEELAAEAEALLPVRDLSAARNTLRSIQDRWEEIGRVPRADMQRIEGRLRAVESALRDAEQSHWRRSNPETKARAQGAAAQLEAAIASLEAELEAAQAGGDSRRVQDLEVALRARREWLEQVERSAQDFI